LFQRENRGVSQETENPPEKARQRGSSVALPGKANRNREKEARKGTQSGEDRRMHQPRGPGHKVQGDWNRLEVVRITQERKN